MPNRKCSFNVSLAESEDKLIDSLSDLLRRCSEQAKDRKTNFSLGLSGGSLVQLLTKALRSSRLDTSNWEFFFCDERYVADDHSDSTYCAYRTEWLSQLPNILDSQFVKADTTKPLDECAADYEAKVKVKVGNSPSNLPQFDLLLLGMGPDGHTCSLFPEQPAKLEETSRLVIPIQNSPKPPPERITFTLPLINNARDVAFVVTGASKSDVVKRVFLDQDKQFPAAWVDPTSGQLTLIVDAGAGSQIKV
ncbi:probable 6-phosphogluconolactonase isoform X1 [Drosophila guanche]|uniref:6-phosphogluconolactonase n=1 Tax=Drosophila guanche TaxID=7266 RepID=A0A3B0KVA9_DROGU|nr:probable 6-phosphogluconolactonase isoform X1 [Drosophila guanche]SPP89291.1 blast:Probable 6-phosphogluconolactonase [Drosophila guanche]